jgi:hypothetical protein
LGGGSARPVDAACKRLIGGAITEEENSLCPRCGLAFVVS